MFIINQQSDACVLGRSSEKRRRGEFVSLGSAIPQVSATNGTELHVAIGVTELNRAATAMTDANTGITGVSAHAAVRMHAPVVATDAFWSYCQETKFGANPKNSHFQRWKVAN